MSEKLKELKMKKHDYDKILYRLTDIWNRLRNGEVLSTKDLALEYNVSTKTIQRDFNERLVSKFPIEKVGHKWRAKEGVSLDKNLSLEEDLVLDMLKEVSTSFGASFSSKANSLFSKIQNEHETAIYSKLLIDDISDKTEVIKQLQEAIKASKTIEFSYKDKYRFLEPYKIATFDGYWYLYANEILENKLKTFNIKDISKLTIKDDTFTKDNKAIQRLHSAINVWFEPNNELFEVRLLVKKDIAKYFQNRPLNNYQRVCQTYSNGDIEIATQVTSIKEISQEIKKWLPNIYVIEPKSVIKEMLKENQEYLNKQIELIL